DQFLQVDGQRLQITHELEQTGVAGAGDDGGAHDAPADGHAFASLHEGARHRGPDGDGASGNDPHGVVDAAGDGDVAVEIHVARRRVDVAGHAVLGVHGDGV